MSAETGELPADLLFITRNRELLSFARASSPKALHEFNYYCKAALKSKAGLSTLTHEAAFGRQCKHTGVNALRDMDLNSALKSSSPAWMARSTVFLLG